MDNKYIGYVQPKHIYDIKKQGLELKDYNMYLEADKKETLDTFMSMLIIFILMIGLGFLFGASYVLEIWKGLL